MGAGSPLERSLAVSAFASELSACSDQQELLETAARAAGECLGLDPVTLYLRDPTAGSIRLHRQWPLAPVENLHGGPVLELAREGAVVLQRAWARGQSLLEVDRAAFFERRTVRHPARGRPVISISPLCAGHHLVGLLCHDRGAADVEHPTLTTAIAVFCHWLAIECLKRHGYVNWRPIHHAIGSPECTEQTPSWHLANRVRQAIDENPRRSGHALAAELGISAGYLSRIFRRHVGVSLVEYKNMIRLDRFGDIVAEQGVPKIKRAALQAGFGSYAQFHRIYKALVGNLPSILHSRPRPQHPLNEQAPVELERRADAESDPARPDAAPPSVSGALPAR